METYGRGGRVPAGSSGSGTPRCLRTGAPRHQHICDNKPNATFNEVTLGDDPNLVSISCGSKVATCSREHTLQGLLPLPRPINAENTTQRWTWISMCNLTLNTSQNFQFAQRLRVIRVLFVRQANFLLQRGVHTTLEFFEPNVNVSTHDTLPAIATGQ